MFQRLARAGAFVVPSCAAIGLIAAPVAHAAGWGAIAYSPATNVYGYSYAAASQPEAEAIAVGFCLEHGGTDCQLAVSSDLCMALAANDSTWAGGWGMTLPEAEAAAMATDPARTVLFSQCA